MIGSLPQAGFIAIGAVAFAPIAPGAGRAVLPHTNQFQLGSMDKKGCFCPCKLPDGKDAKWTVNNPGNGTAKIDIGKYELLLDEKKSQIQIVNKENGEITNIWGDPHIDWDKDGKTDADFWTKTTFQLEDGTKITIDTEPWKGNKGMYVASEVTVTRGDHAMQISGLSQNELGDLKVEYADRGGQALDWAVTDGFVVQENPDGVGWINPETGKLATRQDFEITKPEAVKPYEFTQDFGQALGLYLMTGLFGGGLELGGSRGGWETGRCDYKPAPMPMPKPPLSPMPAVEWVGLKPIAPISRPQVQTPDANTVNIRYPNGAVDTRSGGSLAWRTNNPHLLPFNPITRAMGAIGQADGVAVFRDENAGRDALIRLMLGQTR
ncbi:MAG: DUF1521 domain-containing protein [Pseudomonadota bacterium]|nr:DUF1521 domain-containing protein [Pseudomonadota bacterium]